MRVSSGAGPTSLEAALGQAESAIDATLEVPPARPFGDEFYRMVAALYSRLAHGTRGPAGRIADANGVELTQVHLWVKEARRRGFLGPAQKGKRG